MLKKKNFLALKLSDVVFIMQINVKMQTFAAPIVGVLNVSSVELRT